MPRWSNTEREPVHVDPVDGARPPSHHETEEPGDGDTGETDQTELHCDPTSTSDALRPHQSVRTGFQFVRRKRRIPEDSDDRMEGNDDVAKVLQQAVIGEERGGRRGAVARSLSRWPAAIDISVRKADLKPVLGRLPEAEYTSRSRSQLAPIALPSRERAPIRLPNCASGSSGLRLRHEDNRERIGA